MVRIYSVGCEGSNMMKRKLHSTVIMISNHTYQIQAIFVKWFILPVWEIAKVERGGPKTTFLHPPLTFPISQRVLKIFYSFLVQIISIFYSWFRARYAPEYSEDSKKKTSKMMKIENFHIFKYIYSVCKRLQSKSFCEFKFFG